MLLSKVSALAYLLDGEDALLLLDVGGDDVVEEEEGLGVRRHVDVVLKVSEERAVHHRLRVVLRRQFVTLQKLGDFQNLFSKLCLCACNTLLLIVK